MHGKYFYTLPFQFNHLNSLYQGFEAVKSNNYDILINNSRVWYNVRSIELKTSFRYDLNFVKQLKMKMPKLNLIDFGNYCPSLPYEKHNLYETTLDSVISIRGTFQNIKSINQWLTFALPNLRTLIMCDGDYLTKDNQSTPILNNRTRQLDVDIYIDLKPFLDERYMCLSNVQHLYFRFNCKPGGYEIFSEEYSTISKV